jgi:hypothetical protein
VAGNPSGPWCAFSRSRIVQPLSPVADRFIGSARILGADVATLLGAVGAHDRNVPLAADLCNADAPRIAADLAILNKAALHIGFDVDLDFLAAVRACHDELVIHGWT